MNCVQTDYNNDGRMDIFVVRGAWFPYPVRPTLLRGDGHGAFTDVTEEAGLLDPVNSISATWADYDNDGWIDLFICCERQTNRLYHNLGNGTFEEVAVKAGLDSGVVNTKGAAWIDYDNDNYPDLFQNHLDGSHRPIVFTQQPRRHIFSERHPVLSRNLMDPLDWILRAGHGTTTMTAGRTFSRPPMTERSQMSSRGCWGNRMIDTRTALFSQFARKRFSRRHARGRA